MRTECTGCKTCEERSAPPVLLWSPVWNPSSWWNHESDHQYRTDRRAGDLTWIRKELQPSIAMGLPDPDESVDMMKIGIETGEHVAACADGVSLTLKVVKIHHWKKGLHSAARAICKLPRRWNNPWHPGCLISSRLTQISNRK